MLKPSEALAKNRSDKTTVHSYGNLYDCVLDADRTRSILEVGVGTGSSLRAWHESMPKSTVYGIDVVDRGLTLPSDRCYFAKADSTDPEQVNRTMLGWGMTPGSFDVVIDDGSHTFRDQIATLHLLWSYVRRDGWYVIEDIDPKTPIWPFVRLGGVVHDLRSVKNRFDDVVIVFDKSQTSRVM